MARIFCVPDIHGRNDLLQQLLVQLFMVHKMDLNEDKLIFLGDMIDRGSDSKGVLDTVRALHQKNSNVVVLYGNHEDLAMKALTRGWYSDFELWVVNGGGVTLGSFGESKDVMTASHGIPQDYIDWLKSLPMQHEEPGFFFSHAPVPKESWRKVMNQGQPFTQEELTWTYSSDESSIARIFEDGKIGVCGHIHALSRGLFAPRYYDHYYFLDAGCGCHRDAPLVCTEITTKTPIWVYPKGVTPKSQPKRKYLPPQPEL